MVASCVCHGTQVTRAPHSTRAGPGSLDPAVPGAHRERLSHQPPLRVLKSVLLPHARQSWVLPAGPMPLPQSLAVSCPFHHKAAPTRNSGWLSPLQLPVSSLWASVCGDNHTVGWWEGLMTGKWTLLLGGSGDQHRVKGSQEILMMAEAQGSVEVTP